MVQSFHKLEANNENGKYGKWIELHENGELWTLSTYKNGIKDGKFIRWHENGQKMEEGYFKAMGGTAKAYRWDGLWQYWDNNGFLKRESSHWVVGNDELNIMTDKNEIKKVARYFYLKGLEGLVAKPSKEGSYEKRILYYNNGQKKKEGIIKDGRKIGKWSYWKKDGTVKKIKKYPDLV